MTSLSESRAENGEWVLPIRVLIVDDSVLIREILSEALRSDPEIEIAGTASSGDLALALIPQLRPSLVTIDLALPGTSGYAILAEIRKLNPNLPVIMFSAFSETYAEIAPEASATARAAPASTASRVASAKLKLCGPMMPGRPTAQASIRFCAPNGSKLPPMIAMSHAA